MGGLDEVGFAKLSNQWIVFFFCLQTVFSLDIVTISISEDQLIYVFLFGLLYVSLDYTFHVKFSTNVTGMFSVHACI